ncbi:hypothetical protein BHE74_00026072 [Ensete ventricosum]|nr:hypothetical protein BHE74_00026072 [Ensete ventricosum]
MLSSPAAFKAAAGLEATISPVEKDRLFCFLAFIATATHKPKRQRLPLVVFLPPSLPRPPNIRGSRSGCASHADLRSRIDREPMAEGDQGAKKDVEAAGTKVDEDRTENEGQVLHKDLYISHRCRDDGIERSSCSVDGSCDGGTPEEAENVESPLIHGEGLNKDVAVEPKTQISPCFRQRIAVVGAEGNPNGNKYVPIDVLNGLHPSQSILKLEELERAAESTISTVVVLKTLFYILVWYTFSTCLTL